MPGVFITGVSSGLGLGLVRAYLARGWEVFGVSRRGCPDRAPALHDARVDLAVPEGIDDSLERLLGGVDALDLAILNAGVLGRIADLAETPLDEIRRVMDINVWANKATLDWFLRRGLPVRQIVLISSGAAVNGSRGWGAYALSKATLNMLAQLYAHELAESHLCALAPGLVDTAMQDYLCDPGQVDAARFGSVRRLRAARGSAAMPAPDEAARRIADLIPRLTRFPSGSFQDIRELA